MLVHFTLRTWGTPKDTSGERYFLISRPLAHSPIPHPSPPIAVICWISHHCGRCRDQGERGGKILRVLQGQEAWFADLLDLPHGIPVMTPFDGLVALDPDIDRCFISGTKALIVPRCEVLAIDGKTLAIL